MAATQPTADRPSETGTAATARAYRDQEGAPGTADTGFDERPATLADVEWGARSASRRATHPTACATCACSRCWTTCAWGKGEGWAKARKWCVKCDLPMIDD